MVKSLNIFNLIFEFENCFYYRRKHNIGFEANLLALSNNLSTSIDWL